MSPDYGSRGNEFTGQVKGVQLAIAEDAVSLDHLVSPEEAINSHRYEPAGLSKAVRAGSRSRAPGYGRKRCCARRAHLSSVAVVSSQSPFGAKLARWRTGQGWLCSW